MSKPALLHRIVKQLESDLAVMKAAVADAKENATGEHTRSEGKYDTRAIEAAYLAGAQAGQAVKLAEALRRFDAFDPPTYSDRDPIGPGALVEAEHAGEIVFYLLAPAAGGLTIEYDGFECTVLTPESRLYQDLLGARDGEILPGLGLMVLGIA